MLQLVLPVRLAARRVRCHFPEVAEHCIYEGVQKDTFAQMLNLTQPTYPGRRLRESVRLSFLLLRGDQGPLIGAVA